MNPRKRKRLEAAGWRIGSTREFLQLSAGEAAYIEMRFSLGERLRAQRQRRGWTQHKLARVLRSSQSRIAKMEGGDASVSLDLLIRALLTLGVTRKDVARAVA